MNTPHRAQPLDQVAYAIEIVGGAAALARSLNVTTQAVCFWRDGKRRLPESLGARIESATGGRVTRQSLWPDTWQEVWPELIPGTEKQPPPPDQKAQAAIKNEVMEAAHA